MKNATLRQFKVFETVARHMSYSRAAQELRMSQPAVSIHIRQLEAHAGLPLFEQVGRKIYLTSAGQEMLRHCRAIMREMQAIDAALGALKGIRGGRLDVAVISAGDYFFPGLLAEFCRRYEDVSVSLSVDNRERVLCELAENKSDLCVLLRPPASDELVAEAFAPQAHVVIAPLGHGLAGRRHIPLQEAACEAFIVREQGSDTRLAMDELAAETRVRFNIKMEIRSTETIKQAVIAGMGVSFLSAHTIARELELGRLVVLDVQGFPVMRKWHVMYHKNKRLPPVAVAFKEFLLEEGAGLIEKLVGQALPKPEAAQTT